MKIKKSTISLIVLALISIILITGSPFQISDDLDKNNGHLYVKNNGQEVYAQDDGGGDDGGGGDDDDGGSDDGGSDDSDSDSDYDDSSSDDDSDYESEENVDRSYEYEGENEATETDEEKQFEAAEFKAEEEDDAETDNKYVDDDPNDGWYGGTRDEQGNILPSDTDLAEWEYDNEDERGQLKVDEQGFREYLKDSKGIDLDNDYYKFSNEEKDKMEKEYQDSQQQQKEIESDELAAAKKKVADLEHDLYDAETSEEKNRIDKLLDEAKERQKFQEEKEKLEKALGDGPIPLHEHPKIIPKHDKDDDDDDDKEKDKDKKIIIKKTKKIYKDRDDDDDDDDDNDIDDYAAYNTGYRNGKFDRLSKTSYIDISPFDDKDAKTWYKIGYRAGWDSVITKSASESKIQIK